MEDKVIIEIAELSDAKRLVEIYNWYVENTCISYEYFAVSEADFADRIKNYSKQYPYLVAKINDRIVGYAYACRFHARKSFDWDAEISIYIDKEERRSGIGTLLVAKLLDILEKCKYTNVYSYVNSPNDASFAIHKKFGFTQCSCYKATGFKQGQWRDLVGFAKRIANPEVPEELIFDWQQFV